MRSVCRFHDKDSLAPRQDPSADNGGRAQSCSAGAGQVPADRCQLTGRLYKAHAARWARSAHFLGQQQLNTVPNVRHARILPSCVMRWVSRPVLSSIGPVGLRDLLDWRGSPLSERTRSEIRSLYVDRFRVRFKDIWGQPTGLLYPPAP